MRLSWKQNELTISGLRDLVEPLSSEKEISSFSPQRVAIGSDRRHKTNPAVPETK